MGEDKGKRTKWAVFFPETRKYVSGGNGGLAWTYVREEAEDTAEAFGGRVVDADDLSKNWPEYLEGKR